MAYGLGVDLGTTFTAAAVSSGSAVSVVALTEDDLVMPSVVLAAEDGSLLTGQAAEWRAVGDPLRVARSFKRRLGDPTPLVIGGTPYSPTALMAALLRDVVDRVTAAEGGPPEHVVLTCPAVWGPYRREQFVEVPRLAGLGEVTLLTEPEAAAAHHVRERRIGAGEIVAVYDLGGGTFDTTVLRTRSDGMDILGTPEGIERLGGIDFDEALLAHVDDRLDGAIGRLDPRGPADGAALALLRRECVRAKELLSTEQEATIAVRLPDGRHELAVTRADFEDMIRQPIGLTVATLRRALASAGVEPSEVAAIVLAGGSANIPLVAEALSADLGRPVRAGVQSKFTVALGAAAAAARLTAPTRGPRAGTPTTRAPDHAGAPTSGSGVPAAATGSDGSGTSSQVTGSGASTGDTAGGHGAATAGPLPAVREKADRRSSLARPAAVLRDRRVLTAAAALAVVMVAGLVFALTRGEDRNPGSGSAAGGDPTQPTEVTDVAVRASVSVPTVLTTIDGVGQRPQGSVATPDGRLVLVASSVSETVSVIDTQDNREIARVEIDGQAQYLAISPDGSTAYVTVLAAQGKVAVIDIASRQVVREVPVGPEAFVPAVSPDGSRVYVPDHQTSSIWVFPAQGTAATNGLTVKTFPHGIVLNEDGSTGYVVSHESSAVSVVDLRSNTVVGNIPVGPSALALALSPDGGTLLTTNYDADSVSVVDVAKAQVSTTIRVGFHPQAVVFAPDGRHAYVANNGDDTVSVIELASNTVTATVYVGDEPWSIAVTPDGRFAYVANALSDTVTVISTS